MKGLKAKLYKVALLVTDQISCKKMLLERKCGFKGGSRGIQGGIQGGFNEGSLGSSRWDVKGEFKGGIQW